MLAGFITALLLLLIVMGMPIAFAMAVAGGVGIVLIGGKETILYTLGTYPVSRAGTFSLTTIPLFILMGNLASAAGIATDAFIVASKWLGRLKGGLVMVTIGACGLFAATTGSSLAEAAAVGKIVIPEMKKRGYDMKLAAGSVACAGTLGILIPPSISLVIYGVVAGESIGKLFVAGILPGLLTIILYMAMVYVRVTVNPKIAPKTEWVNWRERARSLTKAWGVLLLFLTVIGGLYAGVATPSQIGALGCFVALCLVLLGIVQGKSSWASLKRAIMETGDLCAMIFAFIIGAGLYSLFITMSQVVPWLVEMTSHLPVSNLGMLIVILFFYIPLGMFFDPLAMILVTVPIIHPIVVQGLGYDSIWFGIVLVKMIEISLITPPLGLNLYVITGLFPDISSEMVLAGSSWFLVMEVLTIATLIAFPSIVTWLPNMMG